MRRVRLKDISDYYTEKIPVSELSTKNYVSTDNMLPNKLGVVESTSLPPSNKVNSYEISDILISNIRPYFKKIWFANKSGGCSADILNIRANSQHVLPKYLFYSLFQDKFFDYVMVGAKGVKMPRGDKDFIMNLELLLPDKEVQDTVISKIEPFFDKIESNMKLIYNLEEYSQLLFHKWFVEFNFPNEEGKPYKVCDGEMYEVDGKIIPVGWKKEKLSESAEFINGLAMQKFPPINENDKLPVIKIKEINNGGFNDNTEFMTHDIDERLIINDGDILFPWSASLGVYVWTGGKGGLNQHIFKAESEKHEKWYIYQWIKKHMPFFKQVAYGKKTTMGHINRRHLDLVDNLIPTDDVMNRMSGTMNPIYSKIFQLKKENQLLEETRDLLIKKLIK